MKTYTALKIIQKTGNCFTAFLSITFYSDSLLLSTVLLALAQLHLIENFIFNICTLSLF